MLAILAENDFSVGEPPQKCLEILRGKSNSVSFTSKVIRKAVHSYLSHEQELTNTVICWLQGLVRREEEEKVDTKVLA